MAKPINKKNPVAAVRGALNLTVEEFSARVGIGVSVLKKIEAGLRPVDADTAKKLSVAIAINPRALQMKAWKEADRAKFLPRREPTLDTSTTMKLRRPSRKFCHSTTRWHKTGRILASRPSPYARP
jgi:transcriptional regulator with XRE-family HTH domain